MALDNESRGYLEGLIDSAIRNTPQTMELFRSTALGKQLGLKDASEFLLGWEWGFIMTGMSSYFLHLRSRLTTIEELNEIIENIRRRSGELKEAIFKTG